MHLPTEELTSLDERQQTETSPDQRLISAAERRHRELLLAIKQEYLSDRMIRRALEPARRSLARLVEIRKLFG